MKDHAHPFELFQSPLLFYLLHIFDLVFGSIEIIQMKMKIIQMEG